MTPSSILLMEPATSERLAFSKAISNTKYSLCHESSDPAATLELYKKFQPDIVVMSAVLAREDGQKLLKKLKEAYPQAKVLMSVYPGDRPLQAHETSEMGVVDCIRKPFNRKKVLEKLALAQGSTSVGGVKVRRKAARMETRLLCYYKPAGKGFFTQKEMAVCEDISSGGILFHTGTRPAEGDVLDLSIELPNVKRPVKATGIIRRVDETTPNRVFKVGVEFQSIDPDDLEKVKAYVMRASDHERRVFHLTKRVPVSVREAGGQLVKNAVTCKIGASGVYLISDVSYPVETELAMEINLGKSGKPEEAASLQGIVKSSQGLPEGKGYEIFVRCIRMETEITEQFQSLISTSEPQGETAANSP